MGTSIRCFYGTSGPAARFRRTLAVRTVPGQRRIPVLFNGGAGLRSQVWLGSKMSHLRHDNDTSQLVEGLAQGCGNDLVRFIARRLRSVADARDVAHEAYVRLLRVKRKDLIRDPQAYLYRIATNTAYDALRRRKLIAWLPWQDLDHEPADVESADPQEIYGTTELVRAALRRMPQQYRAALLLYTQEGFSYSEIAQTLNIAESGVKMYLSRARQSFREHYRALEQGGNK